MAEEHLLLLLVWGIVPSSREGQSAWVQPALLDGLPAEEAP
jgi:hypothetical protein